VPQRVFPDHWGSDGVALRRFYAALAEDVSLDTPPISNARHPSFDDWWRLGGVGKTR
jgi:hypothetical protein